MSESDGRNKQVSISLFPRVAVSHQDHSQACSATRRSAATATGAELKEHSLPEKLQDNASPNGVSEEQPILQHPLPNKKSKLGKVSQGRRDALNGRWVIFAPGRSERPAEILEAELPAPLSHNCPFCAGNESHTPPATLSIRSKENDEFDWTVRVVPNLFPAVSTHQDSQTDQPAEIGSFEEFNAQLHWHDAHWHEPNSVLYQLLHPQRSPTYFGSASAEHLRGAEQQPSDAIDSTIPWTDFADSQSESSFQANGRPNAPASNAPASDWSATDESNRLEDSKRSTDDRSFASGQSEAGPINGNQPNLFEYCELHGGHEVIVETPHHVESLTSLSEAHVAHVFHAYAERIRHWQAVPGVRYVVVFKNVGAAAGASLRHTHSQLIATSLLPPAVEEVGGRMRQHQEVTGRCLVCDMLAGELKDRVRIIAETDRFVVYCPFASRLPYLVRIAPRNHQSAFEQTDADAMAELASLTQQVLRSLETMFVACAYNYTIHTRPTGFGDEHTFHWWMEIFPRLTKVAGFEWGSDCYINPVTPEMAAEHFRGRKG